MSAVVFIPIKRPNAFKIVICSSNLISKYNRSGHVTVVTWSVSVVNKTERAGMGLQFECCVLGLL